MIHCYGQSTYEFLRESERECVRVSARTRVTAVIWSEVVNLFCAARRDVNEEAICTASSAVEPGVVSHSSRVAKVILCYFRIYECEKKYREYWDIVFNVCQMVKWL